MKRTNRKRQPILPVRPQPTIPQHPGTAQKPSYILFSQKFWKIIIGIGIIIPIVLAIEPIKSYFSTPKEKYMNENFVEGDLKPNKISDASNPNNNLLETPPKFSTNLANNPYPIIKGIYLKNYTKNKFLIVNFGGVLRTYLKGDLEEGLDVLDPIFKTCSNVHLYIGIRSERLYVSAVFKDLENEETIGFIEYNHWGLYKREKLFFNNDDKRLEVRDKQYNIAFSVKFEDASDDVSISGYLIDNKSILIMPNYSVNSKYKNTVCLPKSTPNWKDEALNEISKIESIFDPHSHIK
jgi:hypothetical protein